ncbi:hypothetical protein ACJJIC_08295 [Microbulbifer sp. ANSA002]|uniref:spermine/spermidine synthase domain-containing protein n=1 Tax=unclassified Microbulbifer TaxID=2619833 RepID=UPI0040411F70
MRVHYLFLSFVVGLLSLGEEIVWVRIVSFFAHSVPQSFSFVLFWYILGIGLGALLGIKLLKKINASEEVAYILLFLSGILVVASPRLTEILIRMDGLPLLFGVLIALGAGLKGAIFPLVHHWFSRKGDKLGRSLSWVYFCNVLGGALGPVIVGFYLLDIFSMFELLALLGGGEVLVATALLMRKQIGILVGAGVGMGWAFTFLILWHQEPILERLISYQHGDQTSITNLLENKHGVIYTLNDGSGGSDSIYGGNVYDGGFNVNLGDNGNGISRAYVLAGLHENPKKVLVVGLSSGSWVRVISAIPGVERIDVVEINPGYSDIISRYPGASNILSDSRLRFIYTDGRKWAARSIQEGAKYDLVVMNSTWHWRAYSTNLLSLEFFENVQSILNDDGVFTYNTTWSLDSFYTALNVFPYAYMYKNIVYASNRDLNKKFAENQNRLCNLDPIKIEGQSCKDEEFRASIHKLRSAKFLELEEVMVYTGMMRKPELITDDNMLTEYKYGKNFSLK